jgi:metacaspase-1
MKRLEWLVKKATPGDRLLFHFSGHGSQIRDRNGDELRDRMDEILCPHDMDWDGTYIMDDDLDALFSTLPKDVRLEVLLDCCHSGTATRGEMGSPLQPREQRIIRRFLMPPVDIRMREEDDLPVHPIARSQNPRPHVLFSGCRDNQTSADADIGGTYNGAFTYFFCKHLRKSNGIIPRAVLLKNLRASLSYEGFDQVPQLECPAPAKKKSVLA